MSEEKPPDSPVRLVRPVVKRAGSGHVDRALYERLVDFYTKGTRSAGELMRLTGVHRKTARRAIEKGWPENGWDSLRERAAFYDRIQQAAANKESPERAKVARDFLAMRAEYLQLTHGLRSSIAQILGPLLTAIPNSNTTSIRTSLDEVLDAKGAVTKRIRRTVTVQPSILDLANTINQLAGALERTGGGELEQLLAKPPQGATGRRKHALTVEQIEFMAANAGKLPPGVSLEDLGDG